MNVKKELKKCIAMISILTVAIPLVGCAVRREAGGSFELEPDESQIAQTLYTYRIEKDGVNPDEITELLIGCSLEEAEEHKNKDYGIYEVDGKTLVLSLADKEEAIGLSDDKEMTFISYEDDNEGAFSCYSMVTLGDWNMSLMNGTTRKIYPEDELEQYPKEDAIEACRPYAEACGYKNAEVSVYAVTFDIIEKNARINVNMDGDSSNDRFLSAPGPGYEVVTRKQIAELEAAGKTEEAERLNEHRRHGATDREIPWEKRHEAYILTYQPLLEGYTMTEQFDYLVMIYVPMYERPIYIQGSVPYKAVETLESVSIISKEEALGQVLLMKGYESADEIDDVQITFLYAQQANAESGEVIHMAIPCWKVDYVRNQYCYTVVIDAVYGDVYQRSPEY